ncbi:MAG: DUF695 domain-containing protein [Clostridiales bacterium]|nr:DUF695 domain-containing protein [Clostridiales bacterium]
MAKGKKLKKIDNWFEYDWQFEGADALFGVDQGINFDLDKHGKSLITMLCTSRQTALKISEIKAFERKKNSVVCVQKKGFNISYVGYIETMNIVRYYFYTDNCDNLNLLESMFKNQKRISFDCRQDDSHSFYTTVLYPSAAKLQTELNREQIFAYKNRGDNVDVPRKINLHMYFASEPLRILFEEEARLSGYAIGEAEFTMEFEQPHGVIVHKISSLNKHEIDSVTTGIIVVAEKYEGVLMFWDSAFIPKRKGF